jgi:transcriptional regulator with XRE-family HTH domain
MNLVKWRQIVGKLAKKDYRDRFVADHISLGLAFQIRAIRDGRGWSQKELGQRVGMAQETISLLENPNYGRFTLRTLKRLASAFDVALVVRFVPFSQLVAWETNLSTDDLTVPSFEGDPGLAEPSLGPVPAQTSPRAVELHGATTVREPATVTATSSVRYVAASSHQFASDETPEIGIADSPYLPLACTA